MDMLDYTLPQLAKPVFEQLLQLLRQTRQRDEVKLVDLGCSYGVNGALLKWDLDLDTMIDRYSDARDGQPASRELARRDRQWLHRRKPRDIEMLGVDISRNALDYALEAGYLDAKIIGNFEEQALSHAQVQRLKNADLIISTGCIGYVTEKTLSALLRAAEPGRPWMAHFVLRMFSFEPMREMLRQQDYVVFKGGRPFRQRRFASELERDKTLARLREMGLSTDRLEEDGWLYADLFLAVPAQDRDALTNLPVELKEVMLAAA